MNSRERVLAAVNHLQPDRVPVDFGGHRSSGIMAIAYKKLKEYLGIHSGDIYVYDFIQQLAIIEPEVLAVLGSDAIDWGRGFWKEAQDWKVWVLPDGTPCKIPAYLDLKRVGNDWYVYHADGTPLAVQKEGCLYFEQIIRPRAGRDDSSFKDLASELEKVMWVYLPVAPGRIDFNDDEQLNSLQAGLKAFRDSTDKAIIVPFGGNLNEFGQMLYGVGEFLMMLAGEPRHVHRLFDALVEMYLKKLEKFMHYFGPYADIIMFADDIGMQTGPQFSPKAYREFFHERYKLMWTTAKKLGNVKTMLHCCGGVYPLLPGLIEAGLDIIQPVQITCKDMEAEKLKRDFGSEMCFWGGGCDTRDVLPSGTPEQVREHVKTLTETWFHDGGFVFQQVHNIMADVPPENIVAMFEAVNS
jgi:uroporphyrinogen decarboxylase